MTAAKDLALSVSMEDMLVEGVIDESHYLFGRSTTRNALIRRGLAAAEGGFVRLTYRGARIAARIQRKREEASEGYRKVSEIRRENRVSQLLRLGYKTYTSIEHVGERQEDMGPIEDARSALLDALEVGFLVTQIDTNGAKIRIQGKGAYVVLTAQTEEIEPKGRYARHTGGVGLGWARKVCEDNSASVRDMMARARKRGDAVTVDDKGVIRIENAGAVDPSHDHSAGQPCPVWFVPVAKEQHDGHRALMEAGHAQLGALAERVHASEDAQVAILQAARGAKEGDPARHALGLAEHLVSEHGYTYAELDGMHNWPITAQQEFHDQAHGPAGEQDRPGRTLHTHAQPQAVKSVEGAPIVTRVPEHEGYDTLGSGDEWGEDYYLLIDGVKVGGSYFCTAEYVKDGERWASWGPAGLSMGHPTREAAEAVQVEKWKATDQNTPGDQNGTAAGDESDSAPANDQSSEVCA